ncbi:hypothetical protein Agub_g14640 [Astrephomene gubernaculifera]|uniref:Uncharacterized protein n=1 Tax=Astrephomene gubernaculifera TaxID=47775 RepID=A0AAD3E1R6_9CHLO|nr:hypothetical protein Agub_g14640 [Astrephomene gubernaculifera]
MDENAGNDGTSTRTKSKAILNRRPSGYWKVFSHWWRGRYAALNSRPTVHEVIEWYNENAEASWPAGEVPSLKAVLRQSKGLRPIDGLKEYFRMYRKKRKEQGGLALTANVDEGGQRRARAAKRRRARDDSSDEEEEMHEADHEGSACSNHYSSEDGDCDKAETADPSHDLEDKGAPCRLHVSIAADAAAANNVKDDGLQDLSGVHTVLEAWNLAGPGSAAAVAIKLEPSSLPAAGFIAGRHMPISVPELLRTISVQPEHYPLSALDPANGLPEGPAPLLACQSSTGVTCCEQPSSSVIVLPKTRVCRPPPLAAMRASLGSFALLPALSSKASAAAAAAAAGPLAAPPVMFAGQPRLTGALHGMPTARAVQVESLLRQEAEGDDHAGDRCSAGGRCPPGAEEALNGYRCTYPGYSPSHYYPYHLRHPGGAYGDASGPMPYCGSGSSSSDYAPAVPWSTAGATGFQPHIHPRQGAAESNARAHSKLYYPQPYHPSWGGWAPGDMYAGGVWPASVLRSQGSGLCRSSSSSDCQRHEFMNCSDPPSHPVSPQPAMHHQGYGFGPAFQGYARFPPACPESWGMQPNATMEGEVCSSSVSAQRPYHNRANLGSSEQGHRMYGACPPYGMVAIGSSSSMARMAPGMDESAYLAMSADAEAKRCYPVLPYSQMQPAQQQRQHQPLAKAAVGLGLFQGDAAAASGGSRSEGDGPSTVEMPSEVRESELEGVECGLGAADSFCAAAVRDVLDHDLEVAWESFIAGDVGFDTVLT